MMHTMRARASRWRMTGVNYATTTAGDDDGSYNAALARCACTHRAVRATRAVWRRARERARTARDGGGLGESNARIVRGAFEIAMRARARGD